MGTRYARGEQTYIQAKCPETGNYNHKMQLVHNELEGRLTGNTLAPQCEEQSSDPENPHNARQGCWKPGQSQAFPEALMCREAT